MVGGWGGCEAGGRWWGAHGGAVAGEAVEQVALLRCSVFAQAMIAKVRLRRRSKEGSEFTERVADTVVNGLVDGEFVVVAAQVLHEGMTGGDDAQTN